MAEKSRNEIEGCKAAHIQAGPSGTRLGDSSTKQLRVERRLNGSPGHDLSERIRQRQGRPPTSAFSITCTRECIRCLCYACGGRISGRQRVKTSHLVGCRRQTADSDDFRGYGRARKPGAPQAQRNGGTPAHSEGKRGIGTGKPGLMPKL